MCDMPKEGKTFIKVYSTSYLRRTKFKTHVIRITMASAFRHCAAFAMNKVIFLKHF